MRLNFSQLIIIQTLYKRHHHILKNKQKIEHVFLHDIIQLIILKMKMKMKNRSHYNRIKCTLA